MQTSKTLLKQVSLMIVTLMGVVSLSGCSNFSDDNGKNGTADSVELQSNTTETNDGSNAVSEELIENLTAELEGYQTNDTAMRALIANLTAELKGYQTNDTAMRALIANLTAELKLLRNSDAQANITALKAQVASLTAQLGTLETDKSSMEAQIIALNEEINGLKVAGNTVVWLSAPNEPMEEDVIYFMAITGSQFNAVDWFWTFGDGETSTEQNPNHLYAVPGTYTVTLVATDSALNEISAQNPVTVNPWHYVSPGTPGIKVQMDYSDSPADCGESMQFTDYSYSELTITSWLWDFGDGTTSTLQNPTKAYDPLECSYWSPESRSWEVKLTVTDSDGTMETASFWIDDLYADGDAWFWWNSPQNSCWEDEFSFESSLNSHYPIREWFWDFGDGTTSVERKPVHNFPELEETTVTVTLTNSMGNSATESREIDLTRCEEIEAEFVYWPDLCEEGEGQTVHFEDRSYGDEAITSWLWDFGDGTGDTVQYPSHTYAPGITEVTVTLTVANDSGQNDGVSEQITLCGSGS